MRERQSCSPVNNAGPWVMSGEGQAYHLGCLFRPSNVLLLLLFELFISQLNPLCVTSVGLSSPLSAERQIGGTCPRTTRQVIVHIIVLQSSLPLSAWPLLWG